MSVQSASGLLEKLTVNSPEKFPGVDPDERKNGIHYTTALHALHGLCQPMYEEAGQSCLREDILEIQNAIDQGKAQPSTAGLNELLSTKLRYLNGHGTKHLQAVDAKAYDLLVATKLELKPYEVFFLAAALTVHDAGLIFGRDGHEHSIRAILTRLDDTIVTKQERTTIELIAAAHGGHVDNQPDNKATIDNLPEKTQVKGQLIRAQLIAAIVRLADELAEDYNRGTARQFKSPSERREVLGGSEVFHVYSSCLESCLIDGEEQTISLQFLLSLDAALVKFKKGTEEVFLLDEVYSRVLKCFTELVYCNRFIYRFARGASVTPLSAIKVSVDIYGDDDAIPLFAFVFILKESGYPILPTRAIQVYCPEIQEAMKRFGTDNSVPEADCESMLEQGPTGLALSEILLKVRKKS